MRQLAQYIVYLLLCPIVFISYLLEPLTSDVRIYLGTEKLAALHGTFPTNLDLFWEVKPIGSRFVFYVINILDPYSGGQYQIVAKLIPGVVAIFIIWYFSRTVSNKMRVPFIIPFTFTFLGIFAIANFTILESEWFAVLLCMLIISLLFEKSDIWFYLAGFLLVPLILIKGITILLIGLIIPVWLFLEYFDNPYVEDLLLKIRFVSIGFIASSLIGLFLAVTIFPYIIPDALLSAGTIFSSPTLTASDKLYRLFEYFIGLIAFTPIIIVGVIALIFAINSVKEPHLRDIRFLILMWIFPFITVIYMSEFFYYQYYPMVIPAILALTYQSKVSWKGFAAFTLTTLILFATFTAGWSPGMGMKVQKYWESVDSNAAYFDSQLDLSNQSSILYFEPIGSYYYFNAKPACRYTIPLPLQRDTPDHSMQIYPAYNESIMCTMNYTGKYIISDDTWFNFSVPGTHMIVKEKFDNEYVKIWNNTDGLSWDIYKRKPDL